MDLTIDALPWVHDLIADTDHDELAVTAGLGSGKTHGGIQWHLTRCFQNPRSPKSAFCEPLFRLIHSAAIPTFRKVLHSMGLSEGSDFDVVGGGVIPLIRLKRTNQEILFFSSSQPEKIVADEYSHFTNDEAGMAAPLAFQNLQARTRCSEATIHQGLNVGAPQGATHFMDLFANDEEGGEAEGWETIGERDYVHRKLKRRRIRLRTFDNPYVNGGKVLEYVKRLKRQYGHNANLVRSYIYGVFCPFFEGSAFNFDHQLHLCDPSLQESPYRDLYLSFDFNAYPMAWVAFQIVPFEADRRVFQRYIVFQEAAQSLRGLDEALFDFCRKFPRKIWKETPIYLYGDRSGHAAHHRVKISDYDYIKRELGGLYNHVHIRAAKQVAPEVESVETVNQLLNHLRLAVHPRCAGLQRSLLATRWKDGERKLYKPSGDTITHRTDALKYPLYQLEVMDALDTQERVYGINL